MTLERGGIQFRPELTRGRLTASEVDQLGPWFKQTFAPRVEQLINASQNIELPVIKTISRIEAVRSAQSARGVFEFNPSQAPTANSEKLRNRYRKIIYVEDNADTALVVSTQMRNRSGLPVTTITSAPLAYRYLQGLITSQPDLRPENILLIIDFNLPAFDGLELVAALRENGFSRSDMAILTATTHGDLPKDGQNGTNNEELAMKYYKVYGWSKTTFSGYPLATLLAISDCCRGLKTRAVARLGDYAEQAGYSKEEIDGTQGRHF